MSFLERIRAREERKFIFLALWLLIIFLIGGGSRDDIASLVLLRPLAALALAAGLYKLTPASAAPYRFLLAFVSAVIGLVVLHLVPLPPALWQALPQRELIADIDRATGNAGLWRPLSIAPPRTFNALFALMVPVSVIVLAIRLDVRQMNRSASVILVIGAVSVLLALLQVSGAGGGLYFYAIHNAGAALGLFSNRNHQAAFLACLFPLLAAFASAHSLEPMRRRARKVVAASAALMLVPVLLVTGSRAGIVLGLASMIASAFVYRRASPEEFGAIEAASKWRRANRNGLLYAGFGAAAAGLAILTAVLTRAEALRRLLASGETEEIRLAALPPVLELVRSYLPLGSGAGTFVEAFFRAEPRSFLSPTYFNHAHFEYLEWAITGGLPAILLILAAFILIAVAAFRLFVQASIQERGVSLGRAGLVVLFLLAGASIVDYPLRTPSISALAALASVFVWRTTFAGKKPLPTG